MEQGRRTEQVIRSAPWQIGRLSSEEAAQKRRARHFLNEAKPTILQGSRVRRICFFRLRSRVFKKWRVSSVQRSEIARFPMLFKTARAVSDSFKNGAILRFFPHVPGRFKSLPKHRACAFFTKFQIASEYCISAFSRSLILLPSNRICYFFHSFTCFQNIALARPCNFNSRTDFNMKTAMQSSRFPKQRIHFKLQAAAKKFLTNSFLNSENKNV